MASKLPARLFALSTITAFWGCVPTNHQVAADAGMVKVWVAADRIEAGTPLTIAELRVILLPPEYVPEGVMMDVDELEGRELREPILAGEFIRFERFASAEAGGGIAAATPVGTIATFVTAHAGIRKNLEIGDNVDVTASIGGRPCLLYQLAPVLRIVETGVWLSVSPGDFVVQPDDELSVAVRSRLDLTRLDTLGCLP